MKTWIADFGLALDEFLNAVVFDGQPGVTISLHAAQQAQAGKPWACALCWVLSRLVMRNHCALTLAGQATRPTAAIRAGVLLVLLCAVIFGAAYAALRGIFYLI